MLLSISLILYVPVLWEVAIVIMIPNTVKTLHQITSYVPVSFLSILSKYSKDCYTKKIKLNYKEGRNLRKQKLISVINSVLPFINSLVKA